MNCSELGQDRGWVPQTRGDQVLDWKSAPETRMSVQIGPNVSFVLCSGRALQFPENDEYSSRASTGHQMQTKFRNSSKHDWEGVVFYKSLNWIPGSLTLHEHVIEFQKHAQKLPTKYLVIYTYERHHWRWPSRIVVFWVYRIGNSNKCLSGTECPKPTQFFIPHVKRTRRRVHAIVLYCWSKQKCENWKPLLRPGIVSYEGGFTLCSDSFHSLIPTSRPTLQVLKKVGGNHFEG